jgi:acyl carrier protein
MHSPGKSFIHSHYEGAIPMNTQEILKEYITKEIMKGRENQLGPNDDLLATGILDSLGILQLVAFMEERFDVRVPDEDVVYENFHSIAALAGHLATLQPEVTG